MISSSQNLLFLCIVPEKVNIDSKMFHKMLFFKNASPFVCYVVQESTELPIITLACMDFLRCWFIHGVNRQSVKLNTCLHILLGFDYHLPSSSSVEIILCVMLLECYNWEVEASSLLLFLPEVLLLSYSVLKPQLWLTLDERNGAASGSLWCCQAQQSFNMSTPPLFSFSLHVSAPTGHLQVRYTTRYS
jgi:hypothetical protein